MTATKTEYIPKWEGDVLERSKSAEFLTKYLNSLYASEIDEAYTSDSFVLCLNAEWGYGKTYLIKNWAKDLEHLKQHPVIYFDAWQNDFSDDPLLAFISELEETLRKYEKEVSLGKKLIDGVIDTGKGAIAPALKTFANVVVKKVVGTDIDGMAEGFNAISEGAIDSFVNKALESHNNRKEKIKKFSNKLEDLMKKLEEKKFSLPMYVFIDELDRCKPSYAIQLLEGIKHIFGTKGIFFVIATNKAQLSNSIKAIYGHEFDSLGYLQRFFDQEYQLPPPDFRQFAELLITNKYRLNQLAIERLELHYDLVETFSILAGAFNLSLRAQDQTAKQLKAIDLNKSIKGKMHHWFLLFLIMFRIKNEQAYSQFLIQKNISQGYEFLNSYFASEVEIDGQIRGVDDHGFEFEKNAKIKVLTIIKEYIKWENQNAIKLFEQQGGLGTVNMIIMTLRREAPSQHIPNKFYPLSISHYSKIILQAGDIS